MSTPPPKTLIQHIANVVGWCLVYAISFLVLWVATFFLAVIFGQIIIPVVAHDHMSQDLAGFLFLLVIALSVSGIIALVLAFFSTRWLWRWADRKPYLF